MYFLSLTVKATIGKNLTSVELARSLITFIIIFRDLRDEPNGLKLQGSKRTGALAVRSPPRSTIMQPKLTLKPILIACQLRPDVSIKHVTWGSALLISWSLQEQIYTFLHSFPPRGRAQWQPAMAQWIRRKLQCWLYSKFVLHSWETENVGGAEKNDRHLFWMLSRFQICSSKIDNCLVGEGACRPVQKYIDTKGIKGI